MKKLMCFTVCAVMILLIVSECSYAGMDPILHICIANVEKMTGGNSRIKFNPIDYLKEFEDKERWGDMKYIEYRQNPTTIGGGAMLKLLGSGVKKQSAKIPTEKTGLINPKNPIEIISYSDKVLFGFDMDFHGSYSARILDSKGKVLASIDKNTSINQNKGYAEIKVSPKAEKYYVEVTDGDKNPAEYYYIVLTMKATDIKAEPSASFIKQEKEAEKYMAFEQAYMKKHGITKREDLTQKDMEAMVEELRRKDREEYKAKNPGYDMLSHMPEEYKAIISPYMKEHGISSMEDLTIEDWQNLEAELVKLQNKAGAANKVKATEKAKAKNKKRK